MATDGKEPPVETPGQNPNPAKPRLKVVPPKRPKLGWITRDDYDRMADAYLKGNRGATELATAAGVAFRTAKKAIDVGWPKNNWPPLRERAKIYDRIRDDAANTEDPQRAQHARDFLKMREEYLQIAFGVRSALAQGLGRLMPAVADAQVSTVQQMRQVHYEEHLDAQGRVTKRVPHTLTVDVAVPPTVYEVMECVAKIASALERTGGGELEQLLAKPPANGITPKKHKLSWEQIEWMAANGGRLPPGATLDDLGEM